MWRARSPGHVYEFDNKPEEEREEKNRLNKFCSALSLLERCVRLESYGAEAEGAEKRKNPARKFHFKLKLLRLFRN